MGCRYQPRGRSAVGSTVQRGRLPHVPAGGTGLARRRCFGPTTSSTTS